MRFQTIVLIVSTLALCGVRPISVAAQSSSAAGSSRPLPHPDILDLPSDKPASVPAAQPPAQGEASPAENLFQVSRGAGASASSPGSSEAREIARPSPPAGSAFSAQSESRSLGRRETSGRSGFLRDLWPLLAVLLLIAAIAVMLKKFMPARQMMVGSQVLKIVARNQITAKQQIMLVKLGRRLVLIGVSAERMATLATVDDPDQVSLLLGEVASGHPSSMKTVFDETIQEEADTYAEAVEEDATTRTRGQVHGLLQKVRTLAGKQE